METLVLSAMSYSCHKAIIQILFMAYRAIPIIAFHGVESIYVYLCHLRERVRIVYVVKEVASFGGLSQLMGVARNRMHT